MKVLIDECLPLDLRHYFPGHDVHTAQWAGLKSKANGALIEAAELAGYDVLVTIDRSIPNQQNLTGRHLALVIVRAKTNQLEDLLLLVKLIAKAIDEVSPGQILFAGWPSTCGFLDHNGGYNGGYEPARARGPKP